MKKKIPDVNPTRIDESLLGQKNRWESITPLRLGSAAATDFVRDESAIISDADAYTSENEDDLESRFPEDEEYERR